MAAPRDASIGSMKSRSSMRSRCGRRGWRRPGCRVLAFARTRAEFVGRVTVPQFPSYRPVRFHIQRIHRVAAGHIQAIVLRSAEAEVGAAFGQLDEGERLAVRVEHHHAVEILRLALELEHLAARDFGWLGLQRAVGAPAAPEIAVAIDTKAVERSLVGGIDQLGLAAERAVVADIVAPDAAVRCALPLDDVELLLV